MAAVSNCPACLLPAHRDLRPFRFWQGPSRGPWLLLFPILASWPQSSRGLLSTLCHINAPSPSPAIGYTSSSILMHIALPTSRIRESHTSCPAETNSVGEASGSLMLTMTSLVRTTTRATSRTVRVTCRLALRLSSQTKAESSKAALSECYALPTFEVRARYFAPLRFFD